MPCYWRCKSVHISAEFLSLSARMLRFCKLSGTSERLKFEANWPPHPLITHTGAGRITQSRSSWARSPLPKTKSVPFKTRRWLGSTLRGWLGLACYRSAPSPPACSAAPKTPSRRWRSDWRCWKCLYSPGQSRSSPRVWPVCEPPWSPALPPRPTRSSRTPPSASWLGTARSGRTGARRSSSPGGGSRSPPWSPHACPGPTPWSCCSARCCLRDTARRAARGAPPCSSCGNRRAPALCSRPPTGSSRPQYPPPGNAPRLCGTESRTRSPPLRSKQSAPAPRPPRPPPPDPAGWAPGSHCRQSSPPRTAASCRSPRTSLWCRPAWRSSARRRPAGFCAAWFLLSASWSCGSSLRKWRSGSARPRRTPWCWSLLRSPGQPPAPLRERESGSQLSQRGSFGSRRKVQVSSVETHWTQRSASLWKPAIICRCPKTRMYI